MGIYNKQEIIKYSESNSERNTGGIYSIISDNSNPEVYNNTIKINKKAAYLTINGSNLNSYNNAISLLNSSGNLSICANNSLQSIKEYIDNISNGYYNYIDTNNSFTNFPYVYFDKNLENQVGGALYIKVVDGINHLYKSGLKWSSKLTSDGGKYKGLYWQTFNQNSFITNNQNDLTISVENNKLHDQSLISDKLIYQNFLNGIYKNLTFNFNQEYSDTVDGFQLENKYINYTLKAKYGLNIESISLKNVYYFNLDTCNLSELNLCNSNFSTNLDLSNLTDLRGYNGRIYSVSNLDSISGFTDSFNITTYSKTKTNNLTKLGQDQTLYTKGFSIGQLQVQYFLNYDNIKSELGNPSTQIEFTSNLLSYLKSKTYNGQAFNTGNVKIYSQTSCLKDPSYNSTYDVLTQTDFLWYGIYQYNKSKQTLKKISGGNNKDNKDNTFILNKDIKPEQGNFLYSQLTITSEKRNNSYKYGLECHSHKLYKSISQGNKSGTIFPVHSNISHKRITNKDHKSITKQSTSNTTSYYSLEETKSQQLLPFTTGVPVGSIVGFYQYSTDNGNTWLPKVPYGFYELTDKIQSKACDVDDPASLTYNYELMKLFGQTNGLISIPAGKTITIIENTAKIIQILKYAENWEMQ